MVQKIVQKNGPKNDPVHILPYADQEALSRRIYLHKIIIII